MTAQEQTKAGKQRLCFILSLMIAIGYGLAYWQHELGVSPFHISARLPEVDQAILLVTVILPLLVGITLGGLAGKKGFVVLPLYPIVIVLSLT